MLGARAVRQDPARPAPTSWPRLLKTTDQKVPGPQPAQVHGTCPPVPGLRSSGRGLETDPEAGRPRSPRAGVQHSQILTEAMLRGTGTAPAFSPGVLGPRPAWQGPWQGLPQRLRPARFGTGGLPATPGNVPELEEGCTCGQSPAGLAVLQRPPHTPAPSPQAAAPPASSRSSTC